MRIWVVLLTLFVSVTFLPFESTLEQKFGKRSLGLPHSFWRFPMFTSSDENRNAILYDPVVSSWPFGAPDVNMLAELGLLMNLPHIQVMCDTTHMSVHVDMQLNGVELSREELVLGEGCLSNGHFENQLVFTYHHSQCGTNYLERNGRKVFSNQLHFNPKASIATWWLPPFSMPISCTPKRSKLRSATHIPTYPSLPEKNWGFSLKAMHPSWIHPEESNLYYRGQIVQLQAAATIDPHQSLFIQSCFVSVFADPVARPRLGVIVNKGCTASVGSEHAVVAQFVAFRRHDAVNLILETSNLQTEVYLHCSVIISDKGVTADSKCCNYNYLKSRWVELSGDFDVCSCCGSKCKGSSSRNSHIAAKAVVSSGLLIIVDRPNLEPRSVHEPDHSCSPMETKFVQSDSSDPGASVHMTSSAIHGAPAPTAVAVSGDSFSGSALVENTNPEAPWSAPSIMNDVVVISQDLGDTLTMWVPGQLQVKADLGQTAYPVPSMQSEAPAESVQSSSINYEKEDQLYPQKNTVKKEQKHSNVIPSMENVIPSMENVNDFVLRGAEGDSFMKGMDLVSYGWTQPLDLTASFTEPQRKRSSGRSKVPRKNVHSSYRMTGQGFQPQAKDHILNKLTLLENSHNIGDDGLVLVKIEKVEPEVYGRAADDSHSVVRSNLQVSRVTDGSQTLSYREEVRHPGLRGLTTFKMEGKDQQKGLQGKGLALSLLDILRKLDKAE
ncbi:zona pellucida protein C isoform X2 [Osmerus eperlanus]|uniref:zona pellucida protein C isoform X2 n=1 Tax=Osmerus eperlanus TaxID=29151 RepID=UPI002E150960